MPKLRRLSGKEVIKILESLQFHVRRVTGSHYHMQREQDGNICRTTVPVHGNTSLATGTLKSIYRQVLACIDESILKPHFYTE